MTGSSGQVLAADVELGDGERLALLDLFSDIDANPYRHFEGFRSQVRRRMRSSSIPQVLIEYTERRNRQDPVSTPVGYLRNAPIDPDLPVFDFDEPVVSKYARKHTFIAEAFLTLFAELSGTPAIAHLNINYGDVFQDIYPKRSAENSQTQKALNEIAFHKDLANHFVQPDHLYMLGMRNSGPNEVRTVFSADREIVESLPDDALTVARADRFATPFKDIVVHGATVSPPRPERHAIVTEQRTVRLMENRTVGLDAEAAAVLEFVLQSMHRVQRGIDFQPGDFIAVRNQYCLHSKQFGQITDPDSLQHRWVMKTVNVNSLEPHSRYFVDGVPYLVRG
jgi:L-asparagine oxygenase